MVRRGRQAATAQASLAGLQRGDEEGEGIEENCCGRWAVSDWRKVERVRQDRSLKNRTRAHIRTVTPLGVVGGIVTTPLRSLM